MIAGAFSPAMGLHGVGVLLLNDLNIAFRKSDSGSNPNKDIYVFPVQSYRLFGAPKMEPHAWMTLLMIYLYG